MTIALFVEHCTLYYMTNNIKGINMGIMKEQFIEDQIAVEIARKRLFHNFKDVPQHVIDEDLVDEAIERRHDRKQLEMFDDDGWNWSGHR